MTIQERIDSLQAAVERTVQFLGFRKRAYLLCFPKQESFTNIVLSDLARFCHMNEDCPHKDPFEIGKWLGRQEVGRRFQRHLNLTPEELFAIYSGVRNKET
jgi:hypothetical protein